MLCVERFRDDDDDCESDDDSNRMKDYLVSKEAGDRGLALYDNE